jgi:hypothetical protein
MVQHSAPALYDDDGTPIAYSTTGERLGTVTPLWELTSRGGSLRRYSRGYGAATLEALLAIDCPCHRGVVQLVFPPDAWEYR